MEYPVQRLSDKIRYSRDELIYFAKHTSMYMNDKTKMSQIALQKIKDLNEEEMKNFLKAVST